MIHDSMIQERKVRGEARVGCTYPDRMGALACPHGGYGLTDWGLLPVCLGYPVFLGDGTNPVSNFADSRHG